MLDCSSTICYCSLVLSCAGFFIIRLEFHSRVCIFPILTRVAEISVAIWVPLAG